MAADLDRIRLQQEVVDAMAKPWRELVYRHGFDNVIPYLGLPVEQVRKFLDQEERRVDRWKS